MNTDGSLWVLLSIIFGTAIGIACLFYIKARNAWYNGLSLPFAIGAPLIMVLWVFCTDNFDAIHLLIIGMLAAAPAQAMLFTNGMLKAKTRSTLTKSIFISLILNAVYSILTIAFIVFYIVFGAGPLFHAI